jgi:acetolactate synthase-1/2/3 large subunit
MDNKIKLSDYVVQYLESIGVERVFLIPGGGNIHLIDSVGKAKRLKFICNHHEQACAMGAEAYARVSGKIGVCMVTSGPGGTNTITGILGGWLDSVPMLIISGQIRRETMGAGKDLRQLGDQEINIVDIVRSITKYAAVVMKPHDIKYHLQKATYLATAGRPGPVWLDIPIDVQGSYINDDQLRAFKQTGLKRSDNREKLKLSRLVARVIDKLRKAKRPVLLVGNGVRFSGAVDDILSLIKVLKIPVLTGFAGFDLVSSNNLYLAGRPGTIGQRGANFTLQNSDLLIVIGSRLNIRMIGYDFKSFARAAYKVMVDIDPAELNKRTLHIDLKINNDAKDFILEMIRQLKIKGHPKYNTWLQKVREWKSKYPIVLSEYRAQKNYVNPYLFIDILSKYLKPSDVLCLADATASICTYQALQFPQGTRILTNSGCAAMGYGLPASIGACFANGTKKTICLEGDGSIQLNIQELQTIVYHDLPIRIFVYNNQGYASIRLSQKGLFEGKFVASSVDSGISWPDMKKIAKAYGIPTVMITNHDHMDRKIKKVLSQKGPVLCEIMVSPDQSFQPKVASKKLPDGSIVSLPLEDMVPFLSRTELKQNMMIPILDTL